MGKIVIAIGCYDIWDINTEVKRQIKEKRGIEANFELKANLNTLQCVMTSAGDMEVDSKGDKSIRSVLGFEAKIYAAGQHIAKM